MPEMNLTTRIRIFFKMLGKHDGTGHYIGFWDALWYARHLEWWGLEPKEHE